MFGGSRAPSLLLKYATDYVVHKEVVRQLYINGIEISFFDQKKVVYPPLPFYIGSYKFTKVKIAPEFVKELETVSDNGDYYFLEEVLYLRMYGGSRAPSLLPKYATDYVVHKEVVR